jgi:hypothetical protein
MMQEVADNAKGTQKHQQHYMRTEEDSFDHDNQFKEELHPRFQENLSVNDLN